VSSRPALVVSEPRLRWDYSKAEPAHDPGVVRASVGPFEGDPAIAGDPIPVHVRRLLERRFGSVSEVEVLVLLVRSPRPWTVREVAREFVLGEEHTAILLDRLVHTGLIAVGDRGYVFDPAGGKYRQAAMDLADLYPTYRLRIMNLLLSKPRDALWDFAEAFRLRPSDDDSEQGD